MCTTIIEIGARHPERQHDRHRPRGHARAGPALPAPRPRRPVVAARLRLPAVSPSASGCRTRHASGCRPSSTPRSSGPASRSRCRTSRSAAPATSSAASSRDTWRRSASTSTRACWPRRSRRARRRWRVGRRSSRCRRPSSTCRSRHTCPTTTSPTRPRSSSCTGGSPGRGRAAMSPPSARRSSIGTARCPDPVARLVEVAELRLSAEAAGVASISREEGWLVVRFGAGLTRATAMRLLAGPSLPGLRPNDVTFASNQVRLRLPVRSAQGVGPDAGRCRAFVRQPPGDRRPGATASGLASQAYRHAHGTAYAKEVSHAFLSRGRQPDACRT